MLPFAKIFIIDSKRLRSTRIGYNRIFIAVNNHVPSETLNPFSKLFCYGYVSR